MQGTTESTESQTHIHKGYFERELAKLYKLYWVRFDAIWIVPILGKGYSSKKNSRQLKMQFLWDQFGQQGSRC